MKTPYDPMAFTVILATPTDTVTRSVMKTEVDNRADNPRDWDWE